MTSPCINSEPLYNSRIVDNYVKLIKSKYAHINIDDLLKHAGMTLFEVADQGHWFTQEQINRFHEKLQDLSGNKQIAREAGQYAASPDALGAMRQYALGWVSPATTFAIINQATTNLTKSAHYESKKLSQNSVEVTVTPKPGVRENPFQCENRMGFFEAIVTMFNYSLPSIEHSECIFKGGKACRYRISWERSSSFFLKKTTNIVTAILSIFCLLFFISDPNLAVTTVFPFFACIILTLSLLSEKSAKKELNKSLNNLRDTTKNLVDQININYNNALLSNEIGQAISKQTNKQIGKSYSKIKNIDQILESIIKTLEKRLDYDRGLILLANTDKTRLIFKAGYGYSEDQINLLKKAHFSLEKPESKGAFIVSFREQKPVFVNSLEEIKNNLSAKSLRIAEKLGTQSFISCPIICDGATIGILGVDNPQSQRPLVQSDMSFLMGIAPVVGMSIRNAELLEIKEDKFKSTLQVMAASIDARDPLTAGHSAKVTEYAEGICRELGLPDDYTEMVRVAALLHDYGKLAVPDSILKKQGRLTVEEYEQVKLHTEKTRRILEEIKFDGIFQQVPVVAGSHHEKMDGSGYPMGLKGKQIPLGARIIAVADFFEAITAKRHYREPLPLDTAFQLLRNEAGHHFDPKIVEAFIRFFTLHKSREHFPGIARRQTRVPCEVDVALRVNDLTISGQSADISSLGIYVSAHRRTNEITAGTQVALTFTLPDPSAKPIEVQGRIAWVNRQHRPNKHNYPHGFGIEFTHIAKADRKVVSDYVSTARQRTFSDMKELFATG